MKKEKKEKPVKVDQWANFRRPPIKSVLESQGLRKAYELIGEPDNYEIKTPWGVNLKWPEGASVEFWLMLQDLRELLTAESVKKWATEEVGIDEQQASFATKFAKYVLDTAQKRWQDRVQSEHDSDMIELGKTMKELSGKV